MKLTVEKMIYGGAGLARQDGRTFFVQGALPGEEVDTRLTRQKPGFAEAEVLQVLTPAPERVVPGCPYYGTCGGCQYQHAAYAAQVAFKRGILEETLQRGGLRELPPVAVHAAEPWGYRNRIRLHIADGTHAVGYLQQQSHQLLAIDHCPIAAPFLTEALRGVASLAPVYALGSWCAELELFTTQDGGSLLLTLQGRPSLAAEARVFQQMCAALAERLPQLAGAAWEPTTETHDARRQGSRGAHRRHTPPAPRSSAQGRGIPAALRWGARHVVYTATGEPYRVSAGAFFQSNRLLVDTLAALATDGERGGLAWDLFAGVGLFARRLAREFEQVVAVEGSPVSAADLRENLPGHMVVEQSTLAFLERQRARPSLVVLDPPRAGLGLQAAQRLAQIGSRAITYVSCDPATLARDLRVLVDAGYTLTSLALVDMFPQTFHLETVAKLQLG